MATTTESVMSEIEKVKLQAVLKEVEFTNGNQADKYRCSNCGQVALYHYMATCEHIFCGKCHGQFHMKHCPIKNCVQLITEIFHDEHFELEVYKLEARCTFYRNGCMEKVALASYLVHQRECDYSNNKLLPKVWIPPLEYDNVKQLKKDFDRLKSTVTVLQDDDIKMKLICQIDKKMDKLANDIEKETNNIISQRAETEKEEMKMWFTEKIDEIEREIENVKTGSREKLDKHSSMMKEFMEKTGQELETLQDKIIVIQNRIDDRQWRKRYGQANNYKIVLLQGLLFLFFITATMDDGGAVIVWIKSVLNLF